MTKIIILLILTISPLTQAKDNLIYRYFSFEHPTCTIWLQKSDAKYWKHFGDSFQEEVIKKLKLKRLKIKNLNPDNLTRIKKGDLYLKLTKEILPEGIYKKCLVKFQILKSKTENTNKDDKVLFQRDSLRSLPRHTFKGEERCLYALKDTFGIIPYCSIIKK